MPQQHVDSPAIIYETLTDDVTFMDLVGQITFERTNTTLDAISIVTPGQILKGIKHVTGMEVVIHDVTSYQRREYLTDEIDITAMWKVFLLAWPGADGTTLNAAARRVMELFSKATTIETVATPEGLSAMAQILVLIPSDSVVIGA